MPIAIVTAAIVSALLTFFFTRRKNKVETLERQQNILKSQLETLSGLEERQKVMREREKELDEREGELNEREKHSEGAKQPPKWQDVVLEDELKKWKTNGHENGHKPKGD